jgi:hypothetical protein
MTKRNGNPCHKPNIMNMYDEKYKRQTMIRRAVVARCLLAAIIFLGVSSRLFAEQVKSPDNCDQISNQAKKSEVLLDPVASYKVIGDGRLYFHSAPNERCIIKNVFVVPGDELIAYTEYKGWVTVMYFNPKTGMNHEGWVQQTKRLKFIGTERPKY